MTLGREARWQAAALAVALASLVALAVGLDRVGRAARRGLPGHRVARAPGPAEVLGAWRDAGVRGRSVLWLDRDLPVTQPAEQEVVAHLGDPTDPSRVDDENFLYLAMRENLVRRVVYVVPDERWDGYALAARDRPELHRDGSGFIQFVVGVPVVSLPARLALASAGERSLLYVTDRTREFFGAALAERLEADATLSDLVVVRAHEERR
jgi:hypothetical protein